MYFGNVIVAYSLLTPFTPYRSYIKLLLMQMGHPTTASH